MEIVISTLTLADGDAVDELMKRNSRTLGFLPRQVIDNHILNGTVLGARSHTGQLAGYLLYAANSTRFRIAHLCVSDAFRNRGIAKRLVDELKKTATTQKGIRLHCRRDYVANAMWPTLGFIPLDEKPSRSAAGYILTLWYLDLAPDDRLGLFRARSSDEVVDVVIDSQILFDFHDPDDEKTQPSKSLLSDFLADSIRIFITDEILQEINRNDDAERRALSRRQAGGFLTIEHDPRSVEHFANVLCTILPHRTASQKSDIQHLAKTAASTARIFVTRDDKLLREAIRISNLTGLHVVSPTDLIIRHHELLERQSYVPRRIAGVALAWRRWTHEDSARFPFESFLNHRERKGNFKAVLMSFLAHPDRFKVDVLCSGDDAIAIRALVQEAAGSLDVPMVRISRAVDQRHFGQFVVADVLTRAVEDRLDMVRFRSEHMNPSLGHDLLQVGFTKHGRDFVRFCFSRWLGRRSTVARIAELSPGTEREYRRLTDHEMEEHCSPLGLETTGQEYFVVPVRPSYAMSLVDRRGSANDLFGGKPEVLLRWDNVYYRSKSRHRMLKTPARILWYVSRKAKQIVAVSRLDEVTIDSGKALFRRFQKFGILEWADLYEMCDGEPSTEVMALRFSHTFSFCEPVSLQAIREIFTEDGVGLALQSPLKVPTRTFRKIFERGFPK